MWVYNLIDPRKGKETTMKTKTTKKAAHLDCCHKKCDSVHEFCSIPSCGKVGEHLASDHVYVKGVR